MKKERSFSRKVGRNIRRNIVTGLLFLLPIAITYVVLRFLFYTIDDIVRPTLRILLNDIYPGLGNKVLPGFGIIILVILVYFFGLLGSNILGKWLGKFIHRFFSKVPIVSVIYSTAKQLVESFGGEGTTGFKRVVIIEYPRTDCWTIGFLTNLTRDENDRLMAFVYIPTAPTPNSGWVAVVPIEDVYDTDLSVQEALRMVLSGGTVAPQLLKKRPALDKDVDDLKIQ
jgi:uncharacterized membrane protein